MKELTTQEIAGAYLRLLIKRTYKSQEEFAFNYGIDVKSVGRYIRAENGMDSINTIQTLARHFGVDWREFFNEENLQ